MTGRRLVIVAERDHSYLDLDAREMVSIGRAPDNDIVVKDDMVSRRHAQIEKDSDGVLRVRDLKSFNGTYINERRVRDEAFNLWDAVRVGRTKLFLVERDETPPSTGSSSVVSQPNPVAEESAEAPPPDGDTGDSPGEINADGSGADEINEDALGKTRTLDVPDALASKEVRGIIDDVVRREREELERQICRRIRDESGPSLLASLNGFKVRVRRSGPADGGGDFYDVFRDSLLPEEVFASLGSVSGVGVAACVAATVARHTVRGVCATRDEQPITMLGPLREILSETLHPGSALSLLLARVHQAGKVHLACLGGTGALLYNAATEAVEVLRPPGRRDEEAARPEGLEASLKPGDRLLLVSDGAGALRRADGESYGVERLEAKLKEHAAEPPKELVKTLQTDYKKFGGATPERDVTLMVVSRADA